MSVLPTQINLEVRDYECDLQGIVNNAVYLNYLEHARHKQLQAIGLDFAGLHDGGLDLVVTRSEVDYLAPLKSGDQFRVESRVSLLGRVRFEFLQQILRADGLPIVKARIVGTCLVKNSRPGIPAPICKLFDAGV
ncbi:MAG: acyl-CoA thioesterase [Gammaproteobacteria bacterium]|nr:acyl-CoA thioesterase [Gammaproteobacteria bacterium]